MCVCLCVCVCVCVCVHLVTQLFLLFVTFWTCSPPGSSAHRTMQARILEWVAISYSRESSQSRGQTCISLLQVDSLPAQPLGKPAYVCCVCVCVCVRVQSCLTFCDPTNLCPWDSLGKKLEWVVISSSMWSSWPRIEPTSPALVVDSLPLSHLRSNVCVCVCVCVCMHICIYI